MGIRNYSRDCGAVHTDWIRKQVIRAILLPGLLCASGFAQKVVIFGEDRFAHLQPSFTSCKSNGAEPSPLERRANSCASAGSMLRDIVIRHRDGRPFHKVPVWQFPDSQAFLFVAGMTIDADGAPNAYNPDDTGLDELANAGAPAHWDGIVTDRDGNPLIQQESDPFPGYYISCTSLSDETKKFTDPTAYVDASKIPYVVLPYDIAERGGARLGDFAVVLNLRNGQSSFAIYADTGTLGEGSIALADALGIRSDARHGVLLTAFCICCSPVPAICGRGRSARFGARAKNCYLRGAE